MLAVRTAPIVAALCLSSAEALAGFFPSVVIRESEATSEWPFTVDQGELTCIAYGGQRFVFFAEIPEETKMGQAALGEARSVVVSTNPFSLIATIENRDLYRPYDGLETLIRRLAPYESMGQLLCDAPKN